MVFPGQVINVGGSASQSSNSNTSSNSGSVSTHNVKSGESLNIIANKYGVSVNALMKANNLNGYLITPGQTLKILVVVQVLVELQLLKLVMVVITHLLLITKTYTLKVNVLGTYLINVRKLVNQLAHTGQTLNFGQIMQLMTVIK